MVEGCLLHWRFSTSPNLSCCKCHWQSASLIHWLTTLWTFLIRFGSPQTSLNCPAFCTGLPHGYQVGLPCTQVFFQRTKRARFGQFGHTNHAGDLQRWICTLLHLFYLGTYRMLLPASSPSFTIFNNYMIKNMTVCFPKSPVGLDLKQTQKTEVTNDLTTPLGVHASDSASPPIQNPELLGVPSHTCKTLWSEYYSIQKIQKVAENL